MDTERDTTIEAGMHREDRQVTEQQSSYQDNSQCKLYANAHRHKNRHADT